MENKKQIEEMAKALTSYEYKLCEKLPKDKCLLTSAVHAQVSCDYCKISEFLVNAGYRKASDVAREIFEEIDKIISKEMRRCEVIRPKSEDFGEMKFWEGGEYSLRQISFWYTELKKKYIGEDINIPTNTEEWKTWLK